MICVLRFTPHIEDGSTQPPDGAALTGWIIAATVEDAMLRASRAWEPELVEALARADVTTRGRHRLPTGDLLLVQE